MSSVLMIINLIYFMVNEWLGKKPLATKGGKMKLVIGGRRL